MKNRIRINLLSIVAFMALCSSNLASAAGDPGDAEFDRLKIHPYGTAIHLSGYAASIAGGEDNTNSAAFSTIAGGQINAIFATGAYQYDFIGGGYGNVMDGEVNTSVIGGGSVNALLDECYLGVIAGGQGNVISNSAYCVIGGGVGNTVVDDGVHGYGSILSGQNNFVLSVSHGVIGGGVENMIGPSQYNFIGGGARNTNWANTHGTIAGGVGNVLGPFAGGSFIGGGDASFISTNAADSVIGGGVFNYIDTNANYSVIGGGWNNEIKPNCFNAAILGGMWNIVGGTNSTICGGYNNKAYGSNSLAAGFNANANYDGCFVWSDSSVLASVGSSAANQFVVRAAGGFYLGNSSGVISIPSGHYIETSTGGYLTTGGSWVNSSDKNAKANFDPINSADVLRKVSELPISSWNYKAEDASVRHIGPTAQDFYAAFALGQDDRHIGTIDEGGVALAAIQGLNQRLNEKDSLLKGLEAQLAAVQNEKDAALKQLQTQLTALQAQLTILQQAIAQKGTATK